MAQENQLKLDEPSLYQSLDPSGLRDRLRDLPQHCTGAWESSRGFDLPGLAGSATTVIDKVVIGGMGGSAIAGDLAADLAALQRSAPVLVIRDLDLTYAIDPRTLFIACSYSGNTEETLSLYGQARDARARILVVSGGGLLSQRAKEDGVPLLPIDLTCEPRSAVAYNLLLLLRVLQRGNLLNIADADVAQAAQAMDRQVAVVNELVPFAGNPAKQLAWEIRGKLIAVYGSGLFAGLARRWKSQFNENAKVWAFFETVPEVLHNSVEAYRSRLTQQVMVLVLQPSGGGYERNRRHFALSESLRRNGVPHRVVSGEGQSPLAQLMSALVLGDYVSYYLALLEGVDPSPNPSIDEAKELLADQ